MNLRHVVERVLYACPLAACCGCDAERVPLQALDNGHHYCARCAEEVRALGFAAFQMKVS